MTDYRIVDFAPGCEYEAVDGLGCHPIWPLVQGQRVAVQAEGCTWTGFPEHTVWAYVPCTNADCPLEHKDSMRSGHGRAHRAYFRPDELRYEEGANDVD